MKEQLEARLAELKRELEAGVQTKTDLERQLSNLQHKIIYVGGAVKVLEEELEKAAMSPEDAQRTTQKN